jgi:ribosomal protein L40E
VAYRQFAVNTDTSFAPRQCPACGRENPPDATHCGRCHTPLRRPGDVTETPPAPVEDFSLPQRPLKGVRSPLPLYTGVLLAAFGAVLGLYTYGIGISSLLALIPSFIHLYHRAAAPANAFRRPPLTGLAAWAMAAWFALVILIPEGLVFALGFCCIAYGHDDDITKITAGDYFRSSLVFVIGMAAAFWPAFLLTRRLFPPDEYD